MIGGVKTHPLIKDDDHSQPIDQLDGNVSLDFSDSSGCETSVDEASAPPTYIPVQVGHRPATRNPIRLQTVRKTIRRDNKILQAITLPRISCYNMRSLWAKLDNFGGDMHN